MAALKFSSAVKVSPSIRPLPGAASGFLAAYMPDHASKSRLIIPGEKPFTDADANGISGSVTSFVHVFPTSLRFQ